MNICQDHWDRLRAKIGERGLAHLIAQDGRTAAAMLADRVSRGEDQLLNDVGDPDTATPVNFDPLMSAFFAIGGNAMNMIGAAGMNPLYLMAQGDEDPIDFGGFHPGLGAQTRARLEEAGKPLTWPRCSLCYLGLAHELTCTHLSCRLPRVDGYAWMLDRAADDALEKARQLGLVGEEAA